MKRFMLGFSKFVLGLILALLVMALAGLAVGRYFLTRLSVLPDIPVFDDAPAETAPPAASAGTLNTNATETEEPAAEPEKPEEPLPDGAYRAAVTYPTGLIMRSGPGVEYQQLGGVDYNDELIVLQESNGWLKIKTADGIEAWVKGRGNTKRIG